jgi:hypothetical protein
MTYALAPLNDTVCRLTFSQNHTSSFLDVPLPAANLRDLIASLLSDPDAHEVGEHPVTVVAEDTALSIRTDRGRFRLPWRHIWSVLR